MIYMISDPHGKKDFLGFERYFTFCREQDLLIILGDLELNFQPTRENIEFTNFFNSLDINVAFLDGNHENHAYINSFPTEQWCGGTVNRISDKIVHLQRGNIYTIDGMTLLTMGGCKSSESWAERGLLYEGENPSAKEIALACNNLKRFGNRVDYVLTHKYSREEAMPYASIPHTLEEFFRYVDENVTFRHWYSGHWHGDASLDGLHTVIYDNPVALPLLTQEITI